MNATFFRSRQSFLLASLMALAASAVAGASPSAQQQCVPESFTPRPSWISSAVWIPSLDKILAVDSALNLLRLYAPDGTGTTVAVPGAKFPALVTAEGDRLLLKVSGRQVVALDGKTLQDLRPASQTISFLKSVPTSLGSTLSAVYQMTGLDTSSVLAFGLVRGANLLPKGYQSALFRVPVNGIFAAPLDPLLKVAAWDFYILGYPYLASLDNVGYFLDFDGEATKLYKVGLGGAPAALSESAIPAEFRKAPLPVNAAMNGPEDAPPLFQKLEKLQMITGLYADPTDHKLYLLGRIPSSSGVSDWWLYRIDPKAGGAVEGKALLPTHAKHLSIVVSPETFFVIERGELDSSGRQEINGFVKVPASLLEQAPSRGTAICPNLAK